MKRRLHNLTTGRTDAVRRRMWWNIVVCPLFLPLMLTPVSNFPIYWFLWRAWNNRRAWQGGTALRHLLTGFIDNDADNNNNKNADDNTWIDRSKECSRIVRGSMDRKVDDDENDDDDAVCCRVRSSVLASSSSSSGPAVLFVPCHVLDIADKKFQTHHHHLQRRDDDDERVTTTMNNNNNNAGGGGGGEERVSPPEEESFEPGAVREVENMMGARGMTELVGRYHRHASSEG